MRGRITIEAMNNKQETQSTIFTRRRRTEKPQRVNQRMQILHARHRCLKSEQGRSGGRGEEKQDVEGLSGGDDPSQSGA
jgi:hypothetical protein